MLQLNLLAQHGLPHGQLALILLEVLTLLLHGQQVGLLLGVLLFLHPLRGVQPEAQQLVGILIE